MKNTKQVMLRMPPELYDRLSSAADSLMTTPSALARIFVKLQLDQFDPDSTPLQQQAEATGESATPKIPHRDVRRKSNPNASSKKRKRRRK